MRKEGEPKGRKGRRKVDSKEKKSEGKGKGREERRGSKEREE